MKGKKIISCMAFVSISLIAVVLVLGRILNSDITALLQLIALTISEVITAVYAYSFAKERKNIGWLIAYICIVVIIVVFTCIGFASTITALKG